jgi:2-polyprenyl-6-methoxyphenol hydroxylase-like FAD-dependent oxidoreductase
VQADPIHHLIAGLMIEGVDSWPEDEQTMGVHADTFLLAFPQGGGRMRLYQCYAHDQRGRYVGTDAARSFLAAFNVPSLPHAAHIAGARIAGPCQGYPNADTWVDQPVAPGVALIGDAAGHNDPTIGQGLGIAMRDARLVAEALSGPANADQERLANYAIERRERMRRLRLTGRLASKFRCEFGAEADQLRASVDARIARDPGAGLPLLVPFLGPFGVPPDTFGDPAIRRLFGDEWCLTQDGWIRPAGQSSAVAIPAR